LPGYPRSSSAIHRSSVPEQRPFGAPELSNTRDTRTVAALHSHPAKNLAPIILVIGAGVAIRNQSIILATMPCFFVSFGTERQQSSMSTVLANPQFMRVARFYESTIGKKAVMAVTGFILFGYLILHMLGNLQIFLGPAVLDHYAETLHGNAPLLWT